MITIGQLAKQANVNVETVRYYERQGLIAQPPKPEQGHRKYSRDILEKLLFIKRAQGLGFSLAEIQKLLELESSCEGVHALAKQKLALVREKIVSLTALEKSLAELVLDCETNESPNNCPIIASLANSVS